MQIGRHKWRPYETTKPQLNALRLEGDFFECVQNEQRFGGDKRDRTADLLHAMQALSQLSYTPTSGNHFSVKPLGAVWWR